MILDNNGRSVTAYTYSFSEARGVDLQRENDILKQRCSYHADLYLCQLCQFKCPYRKKWSGSND